MYKSRKGFEMTEQIGRHQERKLKNGATVYMLLTDAGNWRIESVEADSYVTSDRDGLNLVTPQSFMEKYRDRGFASPEAVVEFLNAMIDSRELTPPPAGEGPTRDRTKYDPEIDDAGGR
jgi:hypothetical protein